MEGRPGARAAGLLATAVLMWALVAAGTAAPAGAAAKDVRVFALGPKFGLDWVDNPAHFRDKLFALADARRRTPDAPGVQRAAGDVASHLRGPADPADPVRTARDLVTLPEDLGLLAAFTGSRGRLARSAPDLPTAILALIGTYGTVAAHYASRFPALLQRPFPPTRLLAVSLTDTFVRTGVETFAQLADDLDAYLVAGVTLVQDWRVVCTSRATYRPPPGAGPCAAESPALVAQLRDPDEPGRTYAYEATTPKPSTMALVFDPDGKLVAKTVKAYLTPVELPGQLDLVPGEVSGVVPVDTPVGRLGIVTSKDAWMPDVTAKLDQQGAEILVQPEFFVNDTVRRGAAWAPDNIKGSGFSDVLRHPSIKALVLPQLTGNVFDFSADSQLAIAVKPGLRRGTPGGALVGQPAAPGLSAVGRWAVPDVAQAGESIAARRARLGAAGEAMLPTGPTACPDPLVAGPCRGGQVEDVVFADVPIGATPRYRRTQPRRRAAAPFGTARPIAPSREPQRNLSLASRGDVVVAAFEQAGRVLVARSRDRGLHWERPVRVSAAGPGPQWWPSATIAGDGTVWVAWQDGRRVRVVRSAAGAAGAAGLRAVLRFGTPRTAPAVGEARQWRPSVAATGPGTAYLAWVDERARLTGDDLPQAAVLGARVTPDGIGAAVRLDRRDAVAPLAATLDHAWAPDVAARGSRVLVTWVDFREYQWTVAARESADGGATFGAERRVDDTPDGTEAIADTPRAAITPAGRPLVAYTDWLLDATSAAAPSRLYDTKLAGLGPRSAQADDHGAGHVSTFAPSLAAAGGGSALVAWQDAAAGPARIRLARLRPPASPDGAAGAPAAGEGPVVRGRTLRVDDAGRAGAGRARPRVVIAGPRAVVAWEDERDGPSQVYAAGVVARRIP
ncbi:hypothetical protein DSM112329_03918 [Paraconexibacter sp. AEG42_29]|uniref:CN hydrolase domain-containing protein n=1 Tax=Paraconexibacter sp. AEG42_29 TaxID=2997339 RepID=A0AAU7AZH3_9ACTN